jgi:uncharacterized glyoxalase superfamily protein PhnB
MANPALTPDGYPALTPWVITRGVPAFIDFLVGVFNAEETVRLLAADGVSVVHAEARIHGAPLMMFDSGVEWPATPAFLRVYAPDCTEVLRRALTAGAQLVTAPTALFFGDRVCRFTDPWDNLRWVHSRVFAPSMEELAINASAPAAVDDLQYLADTLEEAMRRRRHAQISAG